jgi:hypothetical protein
MSQNEGLARIEGMAKISANLDKQFSRCRKAGLRNGPAFFADFGYKSTILFSLKK